MMRWVRRKVGALQQNLTGISDRVVRSDGEPRLEDEPDQEGENVKDNQNRYQPSPRHRKVHTI